MPACPASFLEKRFPTSGNDTTCTTIYAAVYNSHFGKGGRGGIFKFNKILMKILLLR
jgi:hypothetical protein